MYKRLSTCQEIKPTQRREPLICTPLPGRPWEKVAADICQWKKDNFLVVADYFSRYMEIVHLTNMSAATTIASLKNIFARWGWPKELITDNGPQFSWTVFAQFAKMFDFRHTTTSPHYAQANGEAEAALLSKARPLPELQPGTRVSVKLDNERGWTKCATVVRKCNTQRSYIVQTEQGELRRNRHHLRPICGGPQTTQREQVPLGNNTHKQGQQHIGDLTKT